MHGPPFAAAVPAPRLTDRNIATFGVNLPHPAALWCAPPPAAHRGWGIFRSRWTQDGPLSTHSYHHMHPLSWTQERFAPHATGEVRRRCGPEPWNPTINKGGGLWVFFVAGSVQNQGSVSKWTAHFLSMHMMEMVFPR